MDVRGSLRRHGDRLLALTLVAARLTPRELEVMRLVARGLSNREIAAALVVTEHTAKTDVAHILDKVGLRDRVQAVVFAYESALVRPGDED